MDFQALSNFSNWRQTNQLRGVQPNHPNTVTVTMAPALSPVLSSSSPHHQSQVYQSVSAVLDPSENCLAVATSPLFTGGKGSSSCDVTVLPILIKEQGLNEGLSPIDNRDDDMCYNVRNKTTRDGWPKFYPTLGSSSSVTNGDIFRCRLQCPPHVVPSSIDWLSNEGDSCASTERSTPEAGDLLLIGANKGRIFIAQQDAGNFVTTSTTTPLEVIGRLHTSSGELPVAASYSSAEQYGRCASSLATEAMTGFPTAVRPPGAFIATTTVRGITHSCNTPLVAAVCGSSAHVWDLNGGTLPISTLPISLGYTGGVSGMGCGDASSTEVALTVAWAGEGNIGGVSGSQGQVLAIGGVAGTSFLVDRRTPSISVVKLPPASSISINRAVRQIEFSPVLPYAVAVSSSSGHIGIIDIRKPSAAPIRTIDALSSAIKWLPHHSDMIASGGSDGTVKIWSIREDPCFTIATAQLPTNSSVASLVVPRMYASPPTIFAITGCGQVATIRVDPEVLIVNAPRNLQSEEVQYRQNYSRHNFLGDERITSTNINKSSSTPPPPPSETTVNREHQLESYLYSRNLIKASEIIVSAAKHRYNRGDYEFGLFLCSLLDPQSVPIIDIGDICILNSSTAAAQMALNFLESQRSIDKAQRGSPALTYNRFASYSQLPHDIQLFSTRIPSTVAIESLRGAQLPSPDVTIKIRAIRSGILLSCCLREIDGGDGCSSSSVLLDNLIGVCRAELIPLLKSRPDLIDPGVAVAVVKKLLQYPAIEITSNLSCQSSIEMFRDILDTLTASSCSGTQTPRERVKGRSLAKKLLIVACEPLITDTTMCSWKNQRKLEKGFISHDMETSKEAVYIQLEVMKLEAQRVWQELQQREEGCKTHSRARGMSWGPFAAFLSGPPAPAAKTIVSLVGRYQSNCSAKYLASQSKVCERMTKGGNPQLGVFTWLGRKPLLSYLNALRACGHFTACVWTTQQLLEYYAPYNAMTVVCSLSATQSSMGSPDGTGKMTNVNTKKKAISIAATDRSSTGTILIDAEDTLLYLVDTINTVTSRVRIDLLRLAQLRECSTEAVKSCHKIMTNEVFPIISGLLGFAMELQLVGAVASSTTSTTCYSDFSSGGQPELPPLVKRVVAIVSTAVSELADSFSGLLNFLGDSKLANTVVKATSATAIDTFVTQLEKEVEKKTNEMKAIKQKSSGNDSVYAIGYTAGLRVFGEATTVAEFVLRECDSFLLKVKSDENNYPQHRSISVNASRGSLI